MAMDIKNLIKVEGNGLLSKIQIGGKVYEIKDLVARENIETLAGLLDVLSGKVGNVADGQNLADIIKNIQENAYDDTALKKLISDLDAEVDTKANAADVDAAIKAHNDDIAAINALLNTISDTDDITSLKELAAWVEEHGTEAAEMAAAIEANAKAIADEAKARGDEDTAIDGRLDVIEAALGDGEGSVADQIADALAEAKKYAEDEVDGLDSSLGALAHKDSATGTYVGKTISGVKASGTSTGSIDVALTAGSEEIVSNGDYTPAGTVNGGKVTAAGSVAITITNANAQATLATADYQPAGDVNVTAATADVNVVKSAGTAASFVEGTFTPATLTKEDVTANYATEGLVGEVDEDECLIFTAAGIEAITATKVNGFTGGSKAADSFTANVPAEIETKTVATGIASAAFSGTVAEGLKVTGVTYQKHDSASAVFTGEEVDVTGASFAGSAANIKVKGNGKTYAIDAENTKFNGAAIELNVGDIVIETQTITVE